MAKRTLSQIADICIDRVDESRADSSFRTFCEAQAVLTLQEIISEVPWARWLLEEHSITLTASQQYVTMPSDMDIDAIISLRDTTNNKRTIRISPDDADKIDPGRDLAGDALLWWFQRVGGADRLYFLPQPDGADSLTMISGEIITDPTTNQTTALPAKYESGWVDGTLVKVWERVEPNFDSSVIYSRFLKFLEKVRRDANSAPYESSAMVSHRPIHGLSPFGANFPSNFDVLP